MYITNIIHDINNYKLEGLYTNTDLYKNIKAFTNFHRVNCLLFHRKSYSIIIMLHFLPKRKTLFFFCWRTYICEYEILNDTSITLFVIKYWLGINQTFSKQYCLSVGSNMNKHKAPLDPCSAVRGSNTTSLNTLWLGPALIRLWPMKYLVAKGLCTNAIHSSLDLRKSQIETCETWSRCLCLLKISLRSWQYFCSVSQQFRWVFFVKYYSDESRKINRFANLWIIIWWTVAFSL